MKQLAFLFCLLMISTTLAFAAPPPKSACNTTSPLAVSWTFMDPLSAAGAFLSDGRGTYTQGVDGVANAEIKIGGTNDATIYFPGTDRKGRGRSIKITIPAAISGSIIQYGPPSFAGGPSFLTSSSMNIRNILGDPVLIRGQAATFYTKAGGRFDAPDGVMYQWGSTPDDFTCPSGATCVPNFTGHELRNQPEETAWVKVTYMPRDTSKPYDYTTNADKWLVEGEFVDSTGQIQRSTLEDLNDGHYGQYSLPFKVLITALCAIP